MLRLVFHRVLSTIPVMAVVAIAVFLMLRLSPGDPVALPLGTWAGARADPGSIAP